MVGFVVSKSVGNAVTRNRVRRRLRALVGQRLSAVPVDAGLVVRALAPAAAMSSQQLAHDLDGAIALAARRARQRSAR